ncbi:hypothetical protein C7E25_24995, partial [Stenotrophomonas maltophilia]
RNGQQDYRTVQRLAPRRGRLPGPVAGDDRSSRQGHLQLRNGQQDYRTVQRLAPRRGRLPGPVAGDDRSSR